MQTCMPSSKTSTTKTTNINTNNNQQNQKIIQINQSNVNPTTYVEYTTFNNQRNQINNQMLTKTTMYTLADSNQPFKAFLSITTNQRLERYRPLLGHPHRPRHARNPSPILLKSQAQSIIRISILLNMKTIESKKSIIMKYGLNHIFPRQ